MVDLHRLSDCQITRSQTVRQHLRVGWDLIFGGLYCLSHCARQPPFPINSLSSPADAGIPFQPEGNGIRRGRQEMLEHVQHTSHSFAQLQPCRALNATVPPLGTSLMTSLLVSWFQMDPKILSFQKVGPAAKMIGNHCARWKPDSIFPRKGKVHQEEL